MPKISLKFHLWKRQLQALNSPATEILFGGATEGGKSHFVRVALCVWCLAIPGLQCILIRKKIADILSNHVESPTGFKALLAPLVQSKAVVITQDQIRFPNGSIIQFVHCQDERQVTTAQGVEKHVIVIDEATQISERLIRFFRAWCRMPMEMQRKLPPQYQGKFPRIIYTANPIGASVGFFRRTFVKARPAFAIEKVEGFLRQYIPSRSTDNLSVDQEAHAGRLSGIGDSALAKALDVGDWDAPIGDFFREYNEEKHVVSDFVPPEHWLKFRGFDWGGAEPFAVLWAAVSDGEEFEYNGSEYWFPRGALVIYREWYGCNPDKPAEGLRMLNPDIARGIRERTLEQHSNITLTDSLPFRALGGPTIADIFRDNGVPLIKADTDRIKGWAIVRDKLIGKDNMPMLYICEGCKWLRDYFPALERHPSRQEDAVEHGEATHLLDVVRYLANTFEKIEDAPPKADDTLQVEANNFTFNEVYERHLRQKFRDDD